MEIQELLKDHTNYMTKFQHDHFVTGKAGTPYAQYKQSLRELSARITTLRDFYAEYDLMIVDLDEKKHLVETSDNEFERRRAAIEITRLERGMLGHERHTKEIEEETLSFYSQAVQLRKVVGELTPEKEDQYTKEMWEYRVKKDAALEIMSTGRPSKGTIDMAISLKGELRETVLAALNNPEKLVQELQEKSEEYTKIINGANVDMLDFKTLLLESKK